MEISDLKTSLSDFLGRISAFKKDDFDLDLRNSIYLDYKELYTAYLTLEADQIKEEFSESEIKAIHCLSLGVNSEEKFNELLEEFKTDNETTILNVVDFIKSRNGFDLINKESDFSKFSDEELVEIFGNLFGVEIAKDCVKSLRAEKIGRVVGYALSELFSDHLEEFKELKKEFPASDFCHFLKKKIHEHDVECSYAYQESGDQLEVSCGINEGKGATQTEIRARNRIDHCFVNHKNKVITFGQSTSNKDTKAQGYTYFKAYATLKEMVSQETLQGEANPYKGYKLNPFLMLGGRFVVNEEGVTQEKGMHFKKMLEGATQEELESLGQLQYFRLFGNAVNRDQVNSLPLFNVFIAGCDTLNIYEFSERAALLDDPEEKNKLCFSHLVKQMKKSADILSKNELSFNSGAKGYLTLCLEDIQSISKNLFVNFNREIDETTYAELIAPLHQSIETLREKIKPIAGQAGNEVLNDLRKINKCFASLEDFNDEVRQSDLAPINQLIWKDTEAPAVEMNLSDLSFLTSITETIESEMGSQGKKFFKRFGKTLENKLKYNIENPEDTLSASKSAFLKRYGYESFGQFVEKSAFILDKRIVPGEEVFNKKATELIKFISSDLMNKYPVLKFKVNYTTLHKAKSKI